MHVKTRIEWQDVFEEISEAVWGKVIGLHPKRVFSESFLGFVYELCFLEDSPGVCVLIVFSRRFPLGQHPDRAFSTVVLGLASDHVFSKTSVGLAS